MSTGSSSSRPKASAASAWTPPRQTISSAPDVAIACSIAGWMPRPSRGGARGDDPLDARHLRHDHRHERGGEHRVAAAGHVRADGVDRHVPVPEPDAAQRFDVEVRQRRELALGEVAHALLRECDVLLEVVGKRRLGGFDLVGPDQERVRLPLVEPARQVADGALAAALDVGEHRGDRALDLLACRRRWRFGPLQVGGHRYAARARSSGVASCRSSKPSSRESPAAARTTAAPISL